MKKRSSTRDAQAAEQTKPRRRRTVEYVLVAAGCVLLIDAFVGDKGLLAMMEARQQFRTLEQSLMGARSENEALRDDARRLREDPAAIEELARRDLGLMKPGERLFIIRDVAPGEPR